MGIANVENGVTLDSVTAELTAAEAACKADVAKINARRKAETKAMVAHRRAEFIERRRKLKRLQAVLFDEAAKADEAETPPATGGVS